MLLLMAANQHHNLNDATFQSAKTRHKSESSSFEKTVAASGVLSGVPEKTSGNILGKESGKIFPKNDIL